MDIRLRTGLAALCLCLSIGPVWAQDVDVTVGADVNSAYVWRGRTLNDGVVVQPWLDIGLLRGLGLNVWGNLDVGDYDGTLEEGEFSELRLRGSYGFDLGPVACDVGYIEYLFPVGSSTNGVRAGTREVYVAGEVPIIGGLAARVGVYYDFDEAQDLYADIGLGYDFEPVDRLGVEISAALGYVGEDAAIGRDVGEDAAIGRDGGEDAAIGRDGGFQEYTLTLGAVYDAGDAVVVAGSVAYTDSLDEDVLPEQDVNVYGGISLAYEF